MRDIAQELKFSTNLTQKITQYLQGERLIEFRAIGGIIGITHEGIREIEEAISNPNKTTSHFPSTNITNIIAIRKMENSQIQQSGTEAIQTITLKERKHEEINEIIKLLKESINQLNLLSSQKSDLQAEINTIESQMHSSTTKDTILIECFKSIKNILEGATGNVLATVLLNKILIILGDKVI